MRFGSPGPSEFFSQIRHRNALTEIAWEDAKQGLGMAMSTVATEKNRELLFIATCFTNGDIPFSLVFQGDDLLKKTLILIPSKNPDFAMGKN